MFTTGDRYRVRLLRLVYHFKSQANGEQIREKIYVALRQHYRLAIVLGTIATYFLSSAILQLFLILSSKRDRANSLLLSYFCKWILNIITIKVEVIGNHLTENHPDQGALIIPNHISYLDVLAIQSVFPSKFVTSNDIGQTFFLGHLCKIGGCLFVNRKSKKDLLKNIDQISSELNRGSRIVLFPEGTTSPGDRLLPYKSSLLEAAVRSRSMVYPLCIRYTKLDGSPLIPSQYDIFAWYGSMAFFPHLWQLMQIKSLHIEIRTAEPVPFRYHKSRKTLTSNIREITSHLFHQ
jgi:1-acyl-sn-glycerol-3-phosphate acyltransferase